VINEYNTLNVKLEESKENPEEIKDYEVPLFLKITEEDRERFDAAMGQFSGKV
jgi:hypothetical protein